MVWMSANRPRSEGTAVAPDAEAAIVVVVARERLAPMLTARRMWRATTQSQQPLTKQEASSHRRYAAYKGPGPRITCRERPSATSSASPTYLDGFLPAGPARRPPRRSRSIRCSSACAASPPSTITAAAASTTHETFVECWRPSARERQRLLLKGRPFVVACRHPTYFTR